MLGVRWRALLLLSKHFLDLFFFFFITKISLCGCCVLFFSLKMIIYHFHLINRTETLLSSIPPITNDGWSEACFVLLSLPFFLLYDKSLTKCKTIGDDFSFWKRLGAHLAQKIILAYPPYPILDLLWSSYKVLPTWFDLIFLLPFCSLSSHWMSTAVDVESIGMICSLVTTSLYWFKLQVQAIFYR